MDIAVASAVLVLQFLKRGIKSIQEMKELLQNESDMEKLVHALKELLDGLNGAAFHQHVSESNKDLYNLLETRCTKLYKAIRKMKDKFQRRRAHHLFPVPIVWTSISELKKLRSEFESALEIIAKFESTSKFIQQLHGLQINNPTIDAEQLRQIVGNAVSEKMTLFQSNGFRKYQPKKAHRIQKTRASQPRKSSYQTRRALEWCISRRQARGECRNCGFPGHWETKCGKRCGICNDTSHTVSDCKNDPFCYRCEQTGHMQGDCPLA